MFSAGWINRPVMRPTDFPSYAAQAQDGTTKTGRRGVSHRTNHPCAFRILVRIEMIDVFASRSKRGSLRELLPQAPCWVVRNPTGERENAETPRKAAVVSEKLVPPGKR